MGMNVCIWLFDYNKQCGLAGGCYSATVDRPSSLQQSAKGDLFLSKTSIRLWWAKQSCNQWQFLRRAADENGFYMHQVEENPAALFSPVCMRGQHWKHSQHEKKWTIALHEWDFSDPVIVYPVMAGIYYILKSKMINNFRERSTIIKCLIRYLISHWNYDGRALLMHNRKEIFKTRFPVSSIVTLFILTKHQNCLVPVNPSSEKLCRFRVCDLKWKESGSSRNLRLSSLDNISCGFEIFWFDMC